MQSDFLKGLKRIDLGYTASATTKLAGPVTGL